MNKKPNELGPLERFCTQQPLTSAVLTALTLGFLILAAEIFLHPIHQERFDNWWLSTNSLQTIPLLFVVFYVIFSRFKRVKNSWDRNIDNLFCKYPVLTSGLFSLIAGFSTMIRDLLAVSIWNSSFQMGPFVHAILVTMFSFVICYFSARLLASFIKEKERSKLAETSS